MRREAARLVRSSTMCPPRLPTRAHTSPASLAADDRVSRNGQRATPPTMSPPMPQIDTARAGNNRPAIDTRHQPPTIAIFDSPKVEVRMHLVSVNVVVDVVVCPMILELTIMLSNPCQHTRTVTMTMPPQPPPTLSRLSPRRAIEVVSPTQAVTISTRIARALARRRRRTHRPTAEHRDRATLTRHESRVPRMTRQLVRT